MKTLILLITLPLLLASCTTPLPISGQFTMKNGQVTVHPDGHFEIIVDPHTSK